MQNEFVHAWLNQHYGRMRRYAIKLMGPIDGEDLLQNACETALTKNVEEAEIQQPGPWLSAIVRWTFRKMLKAKKGRRETLATEFGHAESDSYSDQIERLAAIGGSIAHDATQEHLVDIGKHLRFRDDLSSAQREAFDLMVMEEMTATEAALITGKSGTAMTNAMRLAISNLGNAVDGTVSRQSAAKLGARNPSAKLNDEIARGIFDHVIKTPHDLQRLADAYGVSLETVKNIRKKKTWRHIHND